MKVQVCYIQYHQRETNVSTHLLVVHQKPLDTSVPWRVVSRTFPLFSLCLCWSRPTCRLSQCKPFHRIAWSWVPGTFLGPTAPEYSYQDGSTPCHQGSPSLPSLFSWWSCGVRGVRGGREGGRELGREEGREGERKGGREEGREGGREVRTHTHACAHTHMHMHTRTHAHAHAHTHAHTRTRTHTPCSSSTDSQQVQCSGVLHSNILPRLSPSPSCLQVLRVHG